MVGPLGAAPGKKSLLFAVIPSPPSLSTTRHNQQTIYQILLCFRLCNYCLGSDICHLSCRTIQILMPLFSPFVNGDASNNISPLSPIVRI